MPNRFITIRLDTIAIGIRLATTSPVRSPRVTSMTNVTISTACNRLAANSSILRETASGWNWITSKSMPIG